MVIKTKERQTSDNLSLQTNIKQKILRLVGCVSHH